MAIGYANRADVITLRKQQFENHPAVFAQPLRIGGHLHPFINRGHTRGEQLIAALYLHHAKTAGAHVSQAVQVAECGELNAVFARDFQDALPRARAHIFAVDDQGFYFCDCAHAVTSSVCTGAEAMAHTPAGHRLWTMCSMYSSL